MCTLQEQRLRMLRSLQPLTLLLPHLVFKTGLLKPFGELRVLWGMNPHSPCMAVQCIFLCAQPQCFALFGLTVH